MENETFLVIFMYNDSDKAFMMLICFYITVCLQFDGLWQEVWQCTHGRFHFESSLFAFFTSVCLHFSCVF